MGLVTLWFGWLANPDQVTMSTRAAAWVVPQWGKLAHHIGDSGGEETLVLYHVKDSKYVVVNSSKEVVLANLRRYTVWCRWDDRETGRRYKSMPTLTQEDSHFMHQHNRFFRSCNQK